MMSCFFCLVCHINLAGMQIVLVPKGQATSDDTTKSFYTRNPDPIHYRTKAVMLNRFESLLFNAFISLLGL